jgi:hypothetical protein
MVFPILSLFVFKEAERKKNGAGLYIREGSENRLF